MLIHNFIILIGVAKWICGVWKRKKNIARLTIIRDILFNVAWMVRILTADDGIMNEHKWWKWKRLMLKFLYHLPFSDHHHNEVNLGYRVCEYRLLYAWTWIQLLIYWLADLNPIIIMHLQTVRVKKSFVQHECLT